jgi:hypothetical protein
MNAMRGLGIIFRPDLPCMANRVCDKGARKTREESNTYVFDLRLAIHGQRLAACLSTGC